ncbi:pullulanase [Mesomycoplasma hyopneumoniae]|uniref:Pullulanase n=1 Tax=Mesomycoplasma hyopneumoniae (strain J / ATCC 25934 / NCTC 10110) TaxID=262719 RepID=Q4A9A0_MESHJ|nr:pullulanase [Mesomycoplasma hyopneumoniae]AAZ44671.2 pullulanase [Mesomycoplasma hyopneumoniae J]
MIFNYNTSLFRKNFRGESYWGPLGLIFNGNNFEFYLWSPNANRVHFAIYKDPEDKIPAEIIVMSKNNDVWFCQINASFNGYSYNLLIEHHDLKITEALDPYAFSIAPFDWKKNESPKAYLIDIFSEKTGKNPSKLEGFNKNPQIDAQIYQLHIRDFSSISKKTENKGTFIGALENDVFSYLNSLKFNFLQLLPIHSCYNFSQKNASILHKGDGNGHFSTYNWGYDPIGYFSINSSYSTDPMDPYLRIFEFKKFVDSAHKNKIGIVLDVDFSHTFKNSILEDVAHGHFYRDEAAVLPAGFPPLDTRKPMAFRLILDSLIFFTKYYKVDGFRFNLASFLDKKAITVIASELKKVNPNILLYGDFSNFSDLPSRNRLEKGKTGNSFNFGYLNDTIQTAIIGSGNPRDKGLILSKTSKKFAAYVSSIPGNIANFDFQNLPYSKKKYDLFANDISLNLAYLTCYNGPTLADKILSATTRIGKREFLEIYRQALMMVNFVQGKISLSAGTEFAFSRICDFSGGSYQNCYPNLNIKRPPFSFLAGKYLDFHSDKTTDFTNGLNFEILKNNEIKEKIFDFLAEINQFRQNSPFFRLDTNQKIKKQLKFETVDNNKGLIIFKITAKNKVIKVIHNFSHLSYEYDFKNFNILFSSKIKVIPNLIQKHQSILLIKNS